MFSHLRYEGGQVVAQSAAGEFTVKRLLLNTQEAVAYRQSLITHLARTASDLAQATQMLRQAEAHHGRAQTPQHKIDATEVVEFAREAIAAYEQLLEQSIGPLALAAARKAL